MALMRQNKLHLDN